MHETERITDTIFAEDNTILLFISIIESENTTYKLGTEIQGLNVDAKFSKNDNGNFEISFNLKKEDEFNLEYFFIKPALLIAQGVNILIQNKDVYRFQQSIQDFPEIECKVEVKAFRGDLDDSLWEKSKQGAYYRFNTSLFEPYKSGIIFDITTNINQLHSSKNAILLNIEGSPILFYHEMVNKEYGYFIFKSQHEIDFAKFEKVINATRAAFGLISGYYMADSVYFISLKKPKGINGLTYRYNNINESIKNNYPLLDNSFYKNIPKSELNLSSNQFNKLVNLLFNHEEYLRASLLLINAGNLQGISKGSLASVALETIANVIGKKQNKKKIIEGTEIESKLKYELDKVLKKIKIHITKEQLEVFEKKISNINTIPNAQKLEDSFKQLGIELNDEELYCLSCRNKLLHGALPKNNKYKNLNNDELIFLVSNRLIMLSTLLLLKEAGYKGKIIDWGFTEVVKRRAILNGQRIKAGNALRDILALSSSDEKV